MISVGDDGPDDEVGDEGETLHRWIADLFPLCRSITGPGLRKTLDYLGELIPLDRHRIASGTPVFDWTVPDEWIIRDAWIADAEGRRIVDFRGHSLHVVGYSEPVDVRLDLEDLQPHLFSLPDQPDAIPYVTSYYRRTWGFCLSHRQREALPPGRYHAVIDATLAPGHLDYADLVLPGSSEHEVMFSTYVCHPSMANNELSGPVVATALARWLRSRPRRLTYRFVFIPEIIGSLVYLNRHLKHLRERTIAGWVLSCSGDERAWSMLCSRRGDSLADRLTRHVLSRLPGGFREYDYLWPNRGSDERNYCWPGVDLPVVGLMRSKYGTFPEYHTSLDDLSLATPAGLAGSLAVLKKMVGILEADGRWRTTVIGEPCLGRRGLYPMVGTAASAGGAELSLLMNVLAWCDGTHDLIALAERIGADATDCADVLARLYHHRLVEPAPV